MEEAQQKLHDGLDYPGSSPLDGSFVNTILPESEPTIEVKKDEGALLKMGYGPRKQPRPPIYKSHDLLQVDRFSDESGIGDEHMDDVPSLSYSQKMGPKEVKAAPTAYKEMVQHITRRCPAARPYIDGFLRKERY